MKIKDIGGEFGLIERIKPLCFIREENIIKGIGDDCAVCKIDEKRAALFTTDMLVENIHFLRKSITPFQLGYKTMAVNLSDIASMGGNPTDAFLSMAVPEDITVEYIDELYKGMMFLGEKYKVNILGGDTTNAKQDIVLNIALRGEITQDRIMYRDQAEKGDRIYVNGYLGDSAGGLWAILKESVLDEKVKNYLIKSHHMPQVYIKEGIILSESGMVHSCIDISDGISSDLGHICKQSRCGAILYEEKIPLSKELQSFGDITGEIPLDLALYGGEDYRLLFTVDEQFPEKLEEEYRKEFGSRIFCVGEIVEGNEIVLKKKGAKEKILKPSGWDHFRSE
ncbi:MAG: thiamine-phosphate kinase [Candidatus Aminicenantaceae bacterium]